MIKFRIYAGFNDQYLGIHEFANEDEAWNYAYNEALEDLQRYGGYHGYPHPDNMEEYDEQYEGISEEERWNAFVEEAESWLEYDLKPVEDGVEYDEEGEPIE